MAETASAAPEPIVSDSVVAANSGAPGKSWLKRVGVAGFLFFFIKGLAWLIAPLILLESCTPRE